MTTATLIDKPDILTRLRDENSVENHSDHVCNADKDQRLLAIRDALGIVGGKWRIPIIGALTFKGKMRFTELLRAVDGIGAKMLSKELQDLEANQILTRTVKQTKPITVEYEMTPYGLSLTNLMREIVDWGMKHREKIMK